MYNIVDCQLGDYYREGITLEEAKQCAIIFMERSMLEQAGATREAREADEELLQKMLDEGSEQEIAESLAMFDYDLEKVKE